MCVAFQLSRWGAVCLACAINKEEKKITYSVSGIYIDRHASCIIFWQYFSYVIDWKVLSAIPNVTFIKTEITKHQVIFVHIMQHLANTRTLSFSRLCMLTYKLDIWTGCPCLHWPLLVTICKQITQIQCKKVYKLLKSFVLMNIPQSHSNI